MVNDKLNGGEGKDLLVGPDVNNSDNRNINADVIASLWVPSPRVQARVDLVGGHEDQLTWDRQKTHL